MNFDLVNPIEEEDVILFNDPEDLQITLPAELAGEGNMISYGEGEITVTAYSAITGRKVIYTLNNWGIDETDGTSVILGLDEGPEFGYYSNFEIAEGVVEDLFGNVNNALKIEDQVLYSYGYTLEDVVGTYGYAFLKSSGTVETGELVLEEADKVKVLGDDNEYECNVMFTKYYDMDLTDPLYAVFDPNSGTITIPDWQTITALPIVEDDKVVDAYIIIYSTYNLAATTISVPSAGVLDGFDDDAFGYAVYLYSTQQRLGFNWYLSFHAERTGPVPAPSADPAPAAFSLGRVSFEKGTVPAVK